MSTVVTRFAPSPTGHLHIGGARTALFCWAYARRHAGRFMLRVEDTDQARSSESSARGILEDLAWLGIHWDDGPEFVDERAGRIGGDARAVGPFFQSQRLPIYDRALERLVVEGKAYPAFETPEELDAARKEASAAKRTYRYGRAALSIPIGERAGRMNDARREGRPFVVRLLMPDAPIEVHDDVLGTVTYPAEELDDFVLRKADGFPTYHFAVVVDDEAMGVTHVMRGQEHLNNTPRHIALQRALGYRTPRYSHMPLIFNMDGTKMGKRDKDKAAREACRKASLVTPPPGTVGAPEFARWLADSRSQLPADVLERLGEALHVPLPEIEVHDFRRSGYLPTAVCNFISLLGWSPGTKDGQGRDVEKFGMDFLASHFDTSRIGRTNSKFDRVKLLSFNADEIAAMDAAEFRGVFRAWCERFAPEIVGGLPAGRFEILAESVRPRSKTLSEAAARARFAVTPDGAVEFDPKSVDKGLRASARAGEPTGLALLAGAGAAIGAIGEDRFQPAQVHAALEAYSASKGVHIGSVAQALRVALTGTTVSPPIDQTIAAIGRAGTLARIERCVRTFSDPVIPPTAAR